MSALHEPTREYLLRREHEYRRRLLLGLAVLLLLAMSPLVAHHIPLEPEATLAGRDHFWALCMAALHVLLAPIHGLFHLLFVTGVGYATVDRLRAWRRQRSVLSLLTPVAPEAEGALSAAAAAVGLNPARIRVVPGLPSPAFTVGWVNPHVYVDAELTSRLSPHELEAVLAHESAHVKRRDPLRLSALRFLACTLFWLTAVRHLVEDLADEAEVLADDAATRGRPLALAAALLTLAQWHVRRPIGVGFDDRDMLDRRVRRLAGDAAPPRSRLSRRAAGAAMLILMLGLSAGVVAAHPVRQYADGVAEHCQHSGLGTLLHLYCPGYATHQLPRECPHR
jgi:Zn-dependent protease with chaperone function